ALDGRSDLFSLGSVLYVLCTGRPAFRAGNSLAVLKRVCEDPPRPIREINPDIPDWLAAIVGKLLAKDPGQRFQRAAEVADLLSQHLAHLQGPNPIPPSAPALNPAEAIEDRRPRIEDRSSEPGAGGRGRWMIGMVATAALLIAGATGVVL